jgi:predicted dehydrogenase
MDKIKIIIAGAGNRGIGHANQAFNEPNNCEIVGVAEPREEFRNSMAEKYGIKESISSKIGKIWQLSINLQMLL